MDVLGVGTAVVADGRYGQGKPVHERIIGVVEKVEGNRRLVRWSAQTVRRWPRRRLHVTNLRPAV